MTIRTNIWMIGIIEDFRCFRHAMEYAPERTFVTTREMFDTLDAAMSDMLNILSSDGLACSNSDKLFEIEALLFDTLRKSNPHLRSEIEAAIGLGSTLRHGSDELCKRVLEGLERDRDFLEAHQQQQEDAALASLIDDLLGEGTA